MTPERIRSIFMSCKGGEWNVLYPHLGDYIADVLEVLVVDGIKQVCAKAMFMSGLFVFVESQRRGYLTIARWHDLSVAVNSRNCEKIASILSTCPKWEAKYAELGEVKETFIL